MQITTDRRNLHRIPELGWELPRTAEYIRSALEGLNCQVFSPVDCAVCAFFNFGADHAIAFRADMDALPIPEASEASYASTHSGNMHACGHDGHMAILLELARRLSRTESLPHNVLLIFQPGEESPGGALQICQTGILEQHRVSAVFGLHIWPGLESGVVFSREQELMSQGCEITVDIYGKSVHIARAEEGIDALAAGVDFYQAVIAAAESLPPSVYRLLNFGKFHSGTARNAISAHVHMEGSLRGFQEDVLAFLHKALENAATKVEAKYGCRVEITLGEGYPAVMNNPDICRRVRSAVSYRELEAPSMTSEDFSWYQKFVPGMFFFLGAGDVPALHTSNFDFDESILTKGADFFMELAEKFV